jgi:hypothetical protein
MTVNGFRPRATGMVGPLVLVLVVVLASGAGRAGAASGVNCSDFADQASAQDFYLAHGGPAADPEGLDGDHDGIACVISPR